MAVQARHSNTGRYIAYGIAVFIMAIIVLDCSGLIFPMMSPRSDLDGWLADDLGIHLPFSAKMIHAGRVATRDTAYYFELELQPKDVEPFKNAIIAKAGSNNALIDSIDKRTYFGPPPPKWYNPETLPDFERIEVHIENKEGFWMFLSPSTGKVFIFWFTF